MNTTVKDRIFADLQEAGIDISDSMFSIKIGADGQVLSLIHIYKVSLISSRQFGNTENIHAFPGFMNGNGLN